MFNDEIELKRELVQNIHYALREKFMRDTGRDVKCFVTSDISAVVGEVDVQGGVLRFSAPVTVYYERNIHAGEMSSPVTDTRREH